MAPAELAGGVVLAVLVTAWALWLTLSGAALVAWGRTTRRAELGALLAAFGVALALRLAAPAVQHDLNPRSEDLFRSWHGLDWRYGHGLAALFRIVWALRIPLDDRTVFHGVAVWGALTVPLVAVLTRRLGGGRGASAAAAIGLGGLGLHVRYSHTDAPQIVEAALTVLAAILALRLFDDARARVTVALGLTVGLAASMRPEAVVVPALVVAWSVGAREHAPWGRLLAAGTVASVVALPDFLGILAFGSPLQDRTVGLAEGHGLWTYGLQHLVPWAVGFVPPALAAWIMLAPSGRPALRATLATVALLVALGSLVPGQHWSIAPYASWCLARHQLRVLPWMALLIGVGAEAAVDRARRWLPALGSVAPAALVVGVVSVATASTLPDAYARFTLSDEYLFVRAHLDEVPPGCTIATLMMDGDRSLVIAESLKASVGSPHAWVPLDGSLPTDSCVVYYRSAMCTSVSFGAVDTDRCAAFERAHRLSPIALGGLVDRGWLWERFGGAPVRVGFYGVGSTTP